MNEKQKLTDHPVKWGVLGTARIARREVIPALIAADGAELVAIASRDQATAEQCAAEFDVARAYGDYRALLANPDIDAIYIPLPNHLHAEYTIAAAEAGKHILCEKPLADSPGDAEEMFAVCQRHNVLLMEAFMYRFHPQTQRVMELVRAGAIGVARVVRSSHSFLIDRDLGENDFRLHRESGGGCLNDVGVYSLDVAQLVFDDEPLSVVANASYRAPFTAEVALQAVVEYPSDRALVFDCSFVDVHQAEYTVVGDLGRIRAQSAFHAPRGHIAEIEVDLEGELRTEHFQAANEYRLEVEHFTECIRSGTGLAVSKDASLRNLRIAAALLESAHTGKRVHL